MSTVLWVVVALLMIAGCVFAATRVQTAPTTGARVIAGVGGGVLGVLGIILLVAVIFG